MCQDQVTSGIAGRPILYYNRRIRAALAFYVYCSRSGNYYTRRQINLYRMFFADFSVNSQPISMKFWKEYFLVTRRLPWNFHKKYHVVQKLDHLTCSKFEITTSFFKPIKPVKLKFVFSPELQYMPDGLTF